MNDHHCPSGTIRPAQSIEFPAERMVPLETNVMTGEDFHDAFDLVERVLGKEVPQGALFAYLFRRFGHPNKGSDPHKDLAAYLLTTTHPEMFLIVRPYAGGDSSISFTFVVPPGLASACRRWEVRGRDAHARAFEDWIEEQGRIPDWAEETAEGMGKAGWLVPSEVEGWRRMMPGLAMLSYGGVKDDDSEDKAKAVRWYLDSYSKYLSSHPLPEIQWRSSDVSAWEDPDPLKKIAIAIESTLRDLERPIWVHDSPIGIRGRIDETELEDDGLPPLEEAASSGYPMGALGNRDPEGFARLLSSVMALDEDVSTAIERAISIIEATKAPVQRNDDSESEENDPDDAENGTRIAAADVQGQVEWRPLRELEEGLSPGVLDGRAENVFTHGGCDALAIAMHDALGWPIVAITDSHNVHDRRAGGGSAMHWGVQHPSMFFVDVDGIHDQEEITRSYDGDADDGRAAWGMSTRTDAEEWWNEAGRKIRLETAGLFVEAVVDRIHEQMTSRTKDEKR